MRHCFKLIIPLLCLFGMSSCDGTTFQSSVPALPVNIIIDTRGLFVHFIETSLNSYITVDAEGYYENGKLVKPTGAMDAWGYGGVVVYVSMAGYVAYDLACPYCAGRGRKSPCFINTPFAECPHCGEQYDLGSGYAIPQKGISKEALRKLSIMNFDGKLTITQQP